MKTELKFGDTSQTLTIADENLQGVLTLNAVEPDLMNGEEVQRAIQNPIGSPRLKEIIKAGETVAIVTSDITRPMPSALVLPYVLEELAEAGIKDEDIKIVFALGSHRFHTEEEIVRLVGKEIAERYTCIDGDYHDYVHLGESKNGTPVDIVRSVAESDRIVCLGNIEYHYFAGYSGGAKAIMPGVSTPRAIQVNHSLMTRMEAHAGNLETNPVRLDIESVTDYIPIDFIVNVVLNEKKEVLKAVAGHHVEAHREGCRFLDSLYQVPIDEPADIVITSAGGYPKDLNLYQAQKALDNAKHAAKEGGTIILVASCHEGLGNKTFEQWMTSAKSSDELIQRIEEKFELGGHKAAAISLVLEKAKVYLVSTMEADFVSSLFFEPFTNLQEAFDMALQEAGPQAKTLIIPQGGSVLPYLTRNEIVSE